jgi:hypothetical protein
MPKKTDGEDYYNFILFLNYVLCKTGRTPEEYYGRELLTFSLIK